MEVLDKNFTMLSNFEVLKVVNETISELGSTSKYVNPKLYDSLSIVQNYLQITPCSHQTEANIEAFLKAIKKYSTLLKEEKLQILNNHPTKPVDLFILLEGCEDRFSDEEINDILLIVEQTLGNKPATSTDSGDDVADTTDNVNVIASNVIASNDITSNDIASNDITSNDIASNDIASNVISSNIITSNDIVSNDIVSNDIASNDISSNDITSNEITSTNMD